MQTSLILNNSRKIYTFAIIILLLLFGTMLLALINAMHDSTARIDDIEPLWLDGGWRLDI